MRTDILADRLEALVKAADITLAQYNVLRILRGAGEAGLPTLEIGQRMVEQTPGITRLLGAPLPDPAKAAGAPAGRRGSR